MTPTSPVPAPPAPPREPLPLPAIDLRPGHDDCYWDAERAAWVRCPQLPRPRPPGD